MPIVCLSVCSVYLSISVLFPLFVFSFDCLSLCLFCNPLLLALLFACPLLLIINFCLSSNALYSLLVCLIVCRHCLACLCVSIVTVLHSFSSLSKCLYAPLFFLCVLVFVRTLSVVCLRGFIYSLA